MFPSPSTSVHTLAQIALAQLLSPSHAAHSIYLYNEYTAWMEVQGRDHTGFKGFVANRLGRIAEIAQEYLAQRQSILDFFEAVVDVNSNKLVLAVSTYIQNNWFLCCSEVYKMHREIIIFPLMHLLGIEKDLERYPAVLRSKVTSTTTENGRMCHCSHWQRTAVCCRLRRGNYHNQQAIIRDAIFDEREESLVDVSKIAYAPLTNLGCESEFAKLDNRISISGGSTSIETLSRKNVILTNRLLVDPTFTQQSSDEKRSRWKWARTSEEVANVKKVERNFIHTVKNANRLSVLKKEELKKKKTLKVLKLLDTCKAHSGPVTPNSIDILDSLNEKQLFAELCYLRATVAPDIRQMRRVKSNDGRFRMEKFSADELRTSIRNAVQPEDDVTNDIGSLLMNVI